MNVSDATNPEEGDVFGFLLVTAARLMRQRFQADLEAANLGLTASEARTLAMAGRLGPVRQNELAAALSIEPMSLVAHLDRLEAGGLVERRPDPDDRRSKQVYLTASARPQLRRIRRILAQARQRAMADFDAHDTEAFRGYLQRLCDALSVPPLPAAPSPRERM